MKKLVAFYIFFSLSLVDVSALSKNEKKLFKAVKKGKIKKVAKLIKKKVNINKIFNADGFNVLMEAVFDKNIKMVKFLLKKGALPDISEKEFGMTPLMVASSSNQVKIILVLVKYGANVNHLDKLERSALMNAVWSNSAKALKALVDSGADVNQIYKGGITPLMECSMSKQCISIAKTLIAGDAQVNHQSNTGKTALIYSVEHNNFPVFKILYRAGANEYLRDNAGRSVHDFTRQKKRTRFRKYIEKQAKKNKASKCSRFSTGLFFNCIFSALESSF